MYYLEKKGSACYGEHSDLPTPNYISNNRLLTARPIATFYGKSAANEGARTHTDNRLLSPANGHLAKRIERVVRFSLIHYGAVTV